MQEDLTLVQLTSARTFSKWTLFFGNILCTSSASSLSSIGSVPTPKVESLFDPVRDMLAARLRLSGRMASLDRRVLERERDTLSALSPATLGARLGGPVLASELPALPVLTTLASHSI